MICICYFCQKNCFPIWAWFIVTPFFCKLDPKKTIFKRFYQLFFRTAALQHKLLILIESPNIFHQKSAKNSKVGVVFGAKLGPVLWKNKETGISMVSHTLGNNIASVFLRDWKLKFCLRNSIFGPFGGQNVGPGWVKNGKKGYFHTSHLILPKKEVLKNHSLLNTPCKLKDKLTGLHKTLQKFIFTETNC